MKEKFNIDELLIDEPNYQKKEMKKSRTEVMDAKKEQLGHIKRQLKEQFGTEQLPAELVAEMVAIRRQITEKVTAHEYVEELDDEVRQNIISLTAKIAFYKETAAAEVVAIEEAEDGFLQVTFKDGQTKIFTEAEHELTDSLHFYFEAYLLASNAHQFRTNVKKQEDYIIRDNQARKENFYSEAEKRSLLVRRCQEKYQAAGFTETEVDELISTCKIERLDQLEIHDLKILSKIKDIFSRFMGGDRTKYVRLSAALLIPAFLEGYAPSFMADAFQGDRIDMTQIGLYALLSSTAAGLSALLNKQFKDFLNKNFKKEAGMGGYAAKNISELPANEINAFGAETIKKRISESMSSYSEVLKKISFDIMPTAVTLGTSATMLYLKSPILAAGTAGGAGLMLVLDKYLQKKGKFWEKESRAKSEQEEMLKKMEEQLNAHLEIILSGEKEKFSKTMEGLLIKERMASSDKHFLKVIEDKFYSFFSVINMGTASLTTYLAGGSPDKFVSALVYSGTVNRGISELLSSKRQLLSSLRDIMQMDVMFNGYAEEEKEKEKTRVGIDEVKGGGISLKGVTVEFNDQNILNEVNLDIPAGAMAYIGGASGAGKTTLMKVMSGYYRPTAGEVRLGDTDVEKIKKSGPQSMYAKIAYLSQFPYILDDSLKNNLSFGVQETVADAKIKAVLAEVGLDQRFKNLNEKLSGGRGDEGITSGGETSRIGLARILLKIRNSDSRMVFLDEPTASVDAETADEIARVINKEKQQKPEVTFIVISHDKNFVSKLNCDRRVNMKEGKIVPEDGENNK
ncbi:MAG: ABC transporter ATP-binding protein [bacterium]|nr:ABC transporter ATP-binding protein [bacterium]